MAQERHNWLVDGSHTSNSYSSVRIGGSSMAAREATEMGLIGSITFIARTVHRAGARGVAWVNNYHAHTRTLRLVVDERFELPKRSGMAHTVLFALNRSSFPNPAQFFECECFTFRLRL